MTKKEQIMREALAYVCHYYKIQTGNQLLDMLNVVTKCSDALKKIDAIPDEHCGSCVSFKGTHCYLCKGLVGFITEKDFCSKWEAKK